jgi:hypothetical protein
MIDAKPYLTAIGFTTSSMLRAVQEVRQKIDSGDETGESIIAEVLGISRSYDDRMYAMHVAQYVVEKCISNDKIDPEQLIKMAEEHISFLRARPDFAWAFKSQQQKQEATLQQGEAQTTIAGQQVVVKSDGKIKKGGKAVIAVAILDRYLDDIIAKQLPYKPAEMKKLLQDECQMTQAGASTYEFNMRSRDKLVAAYEQKHNVTVVVEKSSRNKS